MAEDKKEGLQRGTSEEPARGGPAKGHTDVPQAETQQAEVPSESNEDKPENQPSVIEAEIEVVGTFDGQVLVRFDNGDGLKEGRIPQDQFMGDPSPGKRTMKMSNAAYTQMVITADPSVMEAVRYRFADSDEVMEEAPRDEAEEVERRHADRQALLDSQKEGDKGNEAGEDGVQEGQKPTSERASSKPKTL